MAMLVAGASAQGQQVERRVQLTQANATNSAWCAEMDAGVFADAGTGLRGMEVQVNEISTPYAITVSEPAEGATEAAKIVDLHEKKGDVLEFDLAMPDRAYTELEFRVRGSEVVAKVDVSGAGSFTVFDLTGRGMGRRLMVELPQEMHEKKLHIAMRGVRKEQFAGVDVPPSREAQSLWTTTHTSTSWTQNFQNMVVSEFEVAAHVPVQRVRFAWDKAERPFRAQVRLEAWPLSNPNDVESVVGEISFTQAVVNGVAVNGVEDVVPMTLGANLQGPAHVRVVVENAPMSTVKLRSVALEMRRHDLCFRAAAGQSVVLKEDAESTNVAPQESYEDWRSAGSAILMPRDVVKMRENMGPTMVKPWSLAWFLWGAGRWIVVVVLVNLAVAFLSSNFRRRHR